ncbi:MAG TPA: tetratricopeptide repeat protein [Bryobacteraceae bacterium]|nr:tetratricopeptide repeat protein [Bryobacteraceae bacterium]
MTGLGAVTSTVAVAFSVGAAEPCELPAPGGIVAEPLLRQAVCYADAGQPERALRLVREHLVRAPASADGYALLGTLLIGSAPAEEARKVLQHALALAPRHPRASIALARVEFLAGRYERTVQLLRPLLARAPPEPDAVILFVEGLLKTGKAREAAGLLKTLVAEPSATTEMHVLAARAHLSANQPEEAAAICERGLVKDSTSETLEAVYFSLPADFLARRLAGWLERAQRKQDPLELAALGRVLSDGDPGRKTRALSIAKAILARAVTLAPEEPVAHYTYGRALRFEEPEAALASWRKALALRPPLELAIEIHTDAARLHSERTEFDAAEKALRAAFEMNRAAKMVRPAAALEFARFLMAQGREQEAEGIIHEVLRWRPLYPAARLERARVLERKKQWEEAISEAEFVLAQSGHSLPLARQARLILARAYRATGRHEKAREQVALLEQVR